MEEPIYEPIYMGGMLHDRVYKKNTTHRSLVEGSLQTEIKSAEVLHESRVRIVSLTSIACKIKVTTKGVIWYEVEIVHQMRTKFRIPNIHCHSQVMLHSDFIADKCLHSKIELAFSKELLQKIFEKIPKSKDYFTTLPRNLAFNLLLYFDDKSILRLSATSEYFYKLCSDPELWLRLYIARNRVPSSKIFVSYFSAINRVGWKRWYFMSYDERKQERLQDLKAFHDKKVPESWGYLPFTGKRVKTEWLDAIEESGIDLIREYLPTSSELYLMYKELDEQPAPPTPSRKLWGEQTSKYILPPEAPPFTPKLPPSPSDEEDSLSRYWHYYPLRKELMLNPLATNSSEHSLSTTSISSLIKYSQSTYSSCHSLPSLLKHSSQPLTLLKSRSLPILLEHTSSPSSVSLPHISATVSEHSESPSPVSSQHSQSITSPHVPTSSKLPDPPLLKSKDLLPTVLPATSSEHSPPSSAELSQPNSSERLFFTASKCSLSSDTCTLKQVLTFTQFNMLPVSPKTPSAPPPHGRLPMCILHENLAPSFSLLPTCTLRPTALPKIVPPPGPKPTTALPRGSKPMHVRKFIQRSQYVAASPVPLKPTKQLELHELEQVAKLAVLNLSTKKPQQESVLKRTRLKRTFRLNPAGAGRKGEVMKLPLTSPQAVVSSFPPIPGVSSPSERQPHHHPKANHHKNTPTQCISTQFLSDCLSCPESAMFFPAGRVSRLMPHVVANAVGRPMDQPAARWESLKPNYSIHGMSSCR